MISYSSSSSNTTSTTSITDRLTPTQTYITYLQKLYKNNLIQFICNLCKTFKTFDQPQFFAVQANQIIRTIFVALDQQNCLKVLFVTFSTNYTFENKIVSHFFKLPNKPSLLHLCQFPCTTLFCLTTPSLITTLNSLVIVTSSIRQPTTSPSYTTI